MSGEEEMRRVPRLNSLLHQVKAEFLLSNQLSMIETSRRRSAYNQDYVGRMRDLAATQLGVLMQLKADLDRLLAPRNVSRTWKDMGVRLTKIPLQKARYSLRSISGFSLRHTGMPAWTRSKLTIPSFMKKATCS